MKTKSRWTLGIATLLLALGCGVKDKEEALGTAPGTPPASGSNAATTGESVLSVSSTTEWVYWSFAKGTTVAVSDAAMSNEWDLRLRRTQFASNSGTSGMGQAGATDTASTNFATVEECPESGYSADASLPLPGPPGSGNFSGNAVLNAWYNYDAATHAVSSKGAVYCIRTATGKYAKLTVVNYASGQMTIKWAYQPNGTRTVK